MGNYFIWSLILTALTGLFAVFNIFFDYEEKHRVKISKWGWIAVCATIILVAGNVMVKYLENEQVTTSKDAAVAKAREREAEAESVRETLILKTDTLSTLISLFSKTAYNRFDLINQEIVTNSEAVTLSLKALDLVSSDISGVAEKINAVNKELGEIDTGMSNTLTAQKKLLEQMQGSQLPLINFNFTAEYVIPFDSIYNVDPYLNRIRDYFNKYNSSEIRRGRKSNKAQEQFRIDLFKYDPEFFQGQNGSFDSVKVISTDFNEEFWPKLNKSEYKVFHLLDRLTYFKLNFKNQNKSLDMVVFKNMKEIDNTYTIIIDFEKKYIMAKVNGFLSSIQDSNKILNVKDLNETTCTILHEPFGKLANLNFSVGEGFKEKDIFLTQKDLTLIPRSTYIQTNRRDRWKSGIFIEGYSFFIKKDQF